jgi:hypothetical protein
MLSSFSHTGHPRGRQLRTVPNPACRNTLRPHASGPKLWRRLQGYLLWIVAGLLETLYYLDIVSSEPTQWLGLICEAYTWLLVARSTQQVSRVTRRQQELTPTTPYLRQQSVVSTAQFPWLAVSRRKRGFLR